MKSTKTLSKCPICSSKLHLLIEGLFDDRYGAPGIHSIYQCESCKYALTKPGLKRKDIGRFYAKYYPHSQANPAKISGNPYPPSKLMAWMLGLGHTCHWATQEGQTVLDIGSGTGRSLIEIRALGGDPYGVEPDPSVQSIAKQLKLEVFQGFITDNPFPRKKFDLITASQVIEHELDPKKFLLAAKSKLKPGGKIILSTPNLNSLGRYIYQNKWINWHIPYHLSFFTQNTIFELAYQSDLNITSYRTISPNNWIVMNLLSSTCRNHSSRRKLWVASEKKSIVKSIWFAFLLIATIIPARIIDSLNLGEAMIVTLESD